MTTDFTTGLRGRSTSVHAGLRELTHRFLPQRRPSRRGPRIARWSGLVVRKPRQVQDSERGRLVVSTGAPTPPGPQPPQGDPNTAAILQLVRVVVGIAGLALGIWGVGHAGGAWEGGGSGTTQAASRMSTLRWQRPSARSAPLRRNRQIAVRGNRPGRYDR